MADCRNCSIDCVYFYSSKNETPGMEVSSSMDFV